MPHRLLTHHTSHIDIGHLLTAAFHSAVRGYRRLERSSPTISSGFTYHPAGFKIPCATHLYASSGTYPGLADRRVDNLAFRGCDDEHSQAQRRVEVRLPDTAGRGIGRHPEGPCRAGLLSHRTGESQGAWIGSGMAGIDGVNVGDPVTAEQMKALFGAGMHPLAANRLEQLDTADLTDASIKAATQLGSPFKVYAARGAGRRFSAGSWSAADSGGDAAFGAAGDVGDAQRQARTPQFVRAADVLAQ